MIVRYSNRFLLLLFLMACLGTLVRPIFQIYGMVIFLLAVGFLALNFSKNTDFQPILKLLDGIKNIVIMLVFFASCLVLPQITLEVDPLASNLSNIFVTRDLHKVV